MREIRQSRRIDARWRLTSSSHERALDGAIRGDYDAALTDRGALPFAGHSAA